MDTGPQGIQGPAGPDLSQDEIENVYSELDLSLHRQEPPDWGIRILIVLVILGLGLWYVSPR